MKLCQFLCTFFSWCPFKHWFLCTFFQDISPFELREKLPAHEPRYPFHVGTHMGKKSQHILLSISGFSNLASAQRKSSWSATSGICTRYFLYSKFHQWNHNLILLSKVITWSGHCKKLKRDCTQIFTVGRLTHKQQRNVCEFFLSKYFFNEGDVCTNTPYFFNPISKCSVTFRWTWIWQIAHFF